MIKEIFINFTYYNIILIVNFRVTIKDLDHNNLEALVTEGDKEVQVHKL